MNLSEVFDSYNTEYKLHIFSGGGGLEHEITWLYQSEDPDSLNYLRGGELVITTGLMFDGSTSWLNDYVNKLIDRKAAGLIINFGKYIEPENLTNGLRNLCNDASFPVILMPWDISIAEFMQSISSDLFERNRKQDIVNNLFQKILLDTSIKHDEAMQLDKLGFPNDSRWNSLSIKNLGSTKVVRDWFRDKDCAYEILEAQNMTNIIFETPDDDDTFQLIDTIFADNGTKRGAFNSDNRNSLIIGMGEAEDCLEKVKFSFNNGINAVKLATKQGLNFFRFKDLGFYQVLLSIDDIDLLKRLEKEYLGDLVRYDEENGGELLPTLEKYIEFDRRVNDVADAMFTHRNTINYRIKKIKEIISLDLTNSDDIFLLKMAIYIRNNLI